MPAQVTASRAPRLMTAIVMREMHTSFLASLTMSIVQTCVRPPKCTARAVPVTSPLRAAGHDWH